MKTFSVNFMKLLKLFLFYPFNTSLTQWMHRFCKISSESFYLAIFSTVKLQAVDCLG